MNALLSESARSFAFGPFVLVPGQQLLLQGPHAVAIGGRAFDLLTALVERHGEAVAKAELMARVWPGLVVEDTNLKVNIAALRRILGAGGAGDRYIATVAGVGYRFDAPVIRRTASRAAAVRTAGNLPLTTRRIFGRDEAIDSVVEALAQARLVSVVGPGGVGKTTVALAAADRAGASFPGGAWFVDLARVETPEDVPGAIAHVIRAAAAPGDHAGWPDVFAHDRDLLLVLDNCEHLVDTVAVCADQLLRGTSKMKLVATSREPLCIRGERVRRLAGLAVPCPREGAACAEALASPAVQLFAARVAETSATFTLDDTSAPLVVALCQRLEGHALAIERVAARVASLGLSRMLDHLDRRFHMFDGSHDGPARHRTLTAAVESSYRYLSDRQQAVLRRLSAAPDTFTLASACAMGAAGDLDDAAVVDDVASLVAKSLLVAEDRGGEMHYRLTHITRAFAAEQLQAFEQRTRDA